MLQVSDIMSPLIAFSVARNTSTSAAASPFPYTIVLVLIGNMSYAASTLNRFVAPVSGVYLVSASVGAKPLSNVDLNIAVNGVVSISLNSNRCSASE